MKTLVTDYAFNKVAKQVTFLGNDCPVSLEEILLITNVTTGDIIYNFADKLRGGSLNNNVLTLVFDTSIMSNSDKLQIFIDSDAYHNEILNMMMHLLKNTNIARDTGDRMRVIVENNPMLITLMRNSYTPMAGSSETWYSYNSHNVVDARENLMTLCDTNTINKIGRWTR